MPDNLTAEWLQSARIHQESAEHALEVKDAGHWCPAAVVNVDSPRLVAAIEAVLAQADEWEGPRAERLVTRWYAAECFRAAITRELTAGAPDA